MVCEVLSIAEVDFLWFAWTPRKRYVVKDFSMSYFHVDASYHRSAKFMRYKPPSVNFLVNCQIPELLSGNCFSKRDQMIYLGYWKKQPHFKQVYVRLFEELLQLTDNTNLKPWIFYRCNSSIYNVCINISQTEIRISRTCDVSPNLVSRALLYCKLLIGYWCLSRGEGWLSRWKNVSPFAWKKCDFILESVNFLSLQLHQLD